MLVPLAGLALVGCGEDRGGEVKNVGGGTTGSTTPTATEPSAAGPAVATVRVSEREYRLSPANPRVKGTGVVRFVATNAGTVAHALEVEGPNGEVEIKPIAPGRSATLRVDLSKPGTYEWYCPIDDHKGRGMRGEIAVAGGG